MDDDYLYSDRIVNSRNDAYYGPLGGMIENGKKNRTNVDISPDLVFELEFIKNKEFLNEHITNVDSDYIKNNFINFPNKLYKNSALILLGFLLCKKSLHTKKDISKDELQKIYTNKEFLPLIQENNISKFDLIRYARFFIIHLNFKNVYKNYYG